MNLVACVKRVPDTTSQVRPAADGKSLDTSGISYIVNPYDEIAVEECLKIQEAVGGQVTILSLGPKDSTKELRQCLAMGAEKAVLIPDDKPNRDAFSTATILAQALKEIDHDVIFFGRQAVDHDNAQVGLMVATLLDLPAVSEVTKVEPGDGKLTVHREADGKTMVIEVPIPCVLTAQKGLNEPRYASLKGIMKAKKKPIDEKALDLPELGLEVVEMVPPPPRPAGKIVGEGVEAVPELVRLLREEAKVL
ncbi:MAG: electron transfer flavoprotein subunit beta/FixA family protein [Planctomycetota bacterium]